MVWEVEYTDQFGEWYLSLSDADQERVVAAVEFLEERGPGLGRPHVDSITASRHSNMKELRPRGGQLRVLFAFDPRRIAILLLGGDKTHRWKSWYDEAIPMADTLYDAHLETLRKEGRIP
ncbi:MAG: type II toxin-antitoxin system RelE/ParE family toxin [Chloroflexota bacterium]|nr:type II toxin-antitoxin system RelE/ParE family toxin [Chloroflexota bacterium]